VARLRDSAGVLIGVSSLYETAPVGGPEQWDYLNAVVVLDTPLSARDLLDLCLEIEQERGRERTGPGAPRTLDLDLLVHGSVAVDEPGLTVPHPRLTERRFVLEPLVEVWGDGPVPGVADLRAALATAGDQDVRRIAGPEWAHRRRMGAAAAATAAVLAGVSVVAGILRRRRGP